MNPLRGPLIPQVRAGFVALVTGMLCWVSAPAGDVAGGGSVVAAVQGAVPGAPENVIFSGQATISGRVIHDPDFGAPPVLEIVVDLSNVSGLGRLSKKTYRVTSQVILRRPLLAFDSVEVSFPFFAEGDMSSARSALASFSIDYSATNGITTSTVVITANRRI